MFSTQFLLYLLVNLRSPLDVFVCSIICSIVCSFVRFWQAFTLTVRINALYNESVHGREEHATRINMIPLKLATLLNLQSLKMCSLYPLRVATIRFSGAWRAGLFGHDHFGS